MVSEEVSPVPARTLRVHGDRVSELEREARKARAGLVENARRNRALRHGGGQQRLDFEGLPLAIEVDDEKILEVNEALELFGKEDAVKAEVVKLRYFVGLNHDETDEVLGLSEKTVRRHWAYAKVWLYQHIQPKSGG